RRHPGTSTETDPDLSAVGPLLVPAGDALSPLPGEKQPAPLAPARPAAEFAAWRRAGPFDGLRRGVPGRVVESRRLARRWGWKSWAEPAAAAAGGRDLGCS